MLVLCLLASGCRGSAPKGEVTCLSCDDHRLVRIVAVDEQAASSQSRRFDHPLSLETKQWETVLRSVNVRSIRRPLLGPSYPGATELAFTDEEVLYLGAALQRAFQEATAQQRVVFALARTDEAGLSQLTSGAWFVEQGRIHLQLANYRVAVTMPSIRKRIWVDPLFAQGEAFYEVMPGAHQEIAKASRDGGSLFRQKPLELAIDYTSLTGQVSVPSSPPVSTEGASPLPPSRPLEDSLGQLKRLYEQGLITEEDYRIKKQQLLDRL